MSFNTAKLISIEGIDGAGKSTQMRYVSEYLKSHNKEVVHVIDPGSTLLGEHIRHALLSKELSGKIDNNTELLLYLASRNQLVKEVLRPALTAGNWVIVDRFIDSTFAYQCGGRGISEAFVNNIYNYIDDLIPDIVILLDVDVEIGLGRVKIKDRFESEDLEFFTRVKNEYLKRASEYSRIKTIDANKDIEEVRNAIHEYLDNILCLN